MANNYLETVEEMFTDLSSFTPEKMQALVGETTEYLSDLKARFESDDTHVRDSAMNMAVEVQAGLQKQMELLLKKAGVDPAQLTALVGSQMNGEQQEVLKQAETQFAQFFSKETEEHKPSKRKKTNKIKLAG